MAPVGKREEIVRVVQLLSHGVAIGRVMWLLTTNMELTDRLMRLEQPVYSTDNSTYHGEVARFTRLDMYLASYLHIYLL